MAPTFPDLARDVEQSDPRLGAARLVVVDGPAGSGKTTFAGRLAECLTAQVVHMDDLYEGWSGLDDAVWERLHAGVLGPLSIGSPGCYRRYDWEAGRFAEEVVVPVTPALVIEGVGAGALRTDSFASLRVWVEASEPVRLERGIARDGDALRSEWLRWVAVEARHFATDGTRARADLVIDGESGGGTDCDLRTYAVLADRRRL